MKRFFSKYLTAFCWIALLVFPVKLIKADSATGMNPGFIENQGQLKNTDGTPASEVLFYGKLPGVNVFLTKNAIIYDFVQKKSFGERGISKFSYDIPLNQISLPEETTHHYRLDMQFSARGTQPEGTKYSGHTNNFYIGNHPEQWVTGVKSYEGLRYPEFYPGIDLLVYFKQDGSGIKYDFELKPGANPELIQYRYVGADAYRIDSKGQLLVETPAGKLIEEQPFTYQLFNGQKQKLKSSFVKQGEQIGFHVPEFNPLQTLIIDPSVLVWSTYFGGNGNTEQSQHLTSDTEGNLIMTGFTNSTNFPVSIGASQTNSGGSDDGFIAKFNSEGQRIWSSYYGGAGIDNARSCATDANGNIFFIGTTGSLNIPTLNPGNGAYFQSSNFATQNKPTNITAFIGKFNAGGQLIWSTYCGGGTGENGIDVWVDKDDNLLVTGATGSDDFPVSSGASQTVYAGPSTGTVIGDMFIGKFSNSGIRQWMTYLGGPLDEAGYGITSDSQGNVYVSGWSKGSTPLSSNPFQNTYGGGTYDALIGKFSATGEKQWVSYYGGSGSERGVDIVFHNNFLYLTGETSSNNLPGPSTGVSQPANAGGAGDGYLVKISPDNSASQVIWRTYTGGSGDDGFDEITVNPSGNMICGGFTASTNYPASPNAYQKTAGGEYDGQIATFDENGQRICASYFGGSQKENVYGLACASNGDIFITGNTGSTTSQGFNIVGNAFQPVKSNGLDSYLARITEIPESPIAAFSVNPNSSCSTPVTVTFTNASISNNTCYSNTTWEWEFPGGTPSVSSEKDPAPVTFNTTGTYRIHLKVTNASGIDTISHTVTVMQGQKVNAGTDQFICRGDSVTLSASGALTYSWSPATGLNTTSGAAVIASPLETTQYIVTGTGGACPPTNDTVLVTVADSLPNPMVSGSSYCPGSPIPPLEVTNGSQYEVSWYTDASLNNQVGTGNFYTPEGPGTWYVIMRQSTCKSNVASFTLLEQIIQAKIETNISNPVIPYNLIATSKSVNASSCSWFLNDSLLDYTEGSSYIIEEPGDYKLTLICKNPFGCEASDSVLFTVIDDKVELIIPNVFSPDNDAKNDLFSFTVSGIKTLKGIIFNRWGKEVYKWEGTVDYWDGTIKGKEAADGVYFYVVETTDILDQKKLEKGTVTLIRGK